MAVEQTVQNGPFLALLWVYPHQFRMDSRAGGLAARTAKRINGAHAELVVVVVVGAAAAARR